MRVLEFQKCGVLLRLPVPEVAIGSSTASFLFVMKDEKQIN
jgi:hypothetical protein